MVKHKISINIAKPGGTPSPVVRSGTMQIRKRMLLDLWECHKQYNGLSKPAREYFIDDIIPAGI